MLAQQNQMLLVKAWSPVKRPFSLAIPVSMAIIIGLRWYLLSISIYRPKEIDGYWVLPQ